MGKGAGRIEPAEMEAIKTNPISLFVDRITAQTSALIEGIDTAIHTAKKLLSKEYIRAKLSKPHDHNYLFVSFIHSSLVLNQIF